MNARPSDFHVHIIHEELIEIARTRSSINDFGGRKPAPRPPGSRRDTIFILMLGRRFHVGAMDERQAGHPRPGTSTVLQGTAWRIRNRTYATAA